MRLWKTGSHVIMKDSSVTQSCPTLCDPMDCSMPVFPISQSLLKLVSIELVMPPNYFIVCRPLILPSIFPSVGVFSVSWLFASGGQSIGASASASILPMNIQDWSPLRLTGLNSLSPRDSQESSPMPQFKSISSLALSFLYGPTLKSTWLLEKP